VLAPEDFARLPVPDELLKFNALLDAEKAAKAREKKDRKAAEARDKRVADAERAKSDAAAEVRRLADSSDATREAKDAADQAYKLAVANLTAIKEGREPEPAPADTPADDGAPTDPVADDASEGADDASEGADDASEGDDPPTDGAEAADGAEASGPEDEVEAAPAVTPDVESVPAEDGGEPDSGDPGADLATGGDPAEPSAG
jgi:hypothetical protein